MQLIIGTLEYIDLSIFTNYSKTLLQLHLDYRPEYQHLYYLWTKHKLSTEIYSLTCISESSYIKQ